MVHRIYLQCTQHDLDTNTQPSCIVRDISQTRLQDSGATSALPVACLKPVPHPALPYIQWF